MTDAVVVAGSVPAGQPDGRRLLRTVTRSPAAVAGLVGVALIVGVTLLAPLVAPHDPPPRTSPTSSPPRCGRGAMPTTCSGPTPSGAMSPAGSSTAGATRC